MRRAAVAERERVLAEVQAESLPLRALLVHLGTLPLKGIHLTALRVGQMLEIEGEAESYEALATMTEHIAADEFFRAPPVLAEASREDGYIRFVCARMVWDCDAAGDGASADDGGTDLGVFPCPFIRGIVVAVFFCRARGRTGGA